MKFERVRLLNKVYLKAKTPAGSDIYHIPTATDTMIQLNNGEDGVFINIFKLGTDEPFRVQGTVEEMNEVWGANDAVRNV